MSGRPRAGRPAGSQGTLSLARAAELAELAGGRGDLGPWGEPLVAVDLSLGGGIHSDAAQLLSRVPAVVVGVGGSHDPEEAPLGAFDILLTEEPAPRPWVTVEGSVVSELEALARKVRSHPITSLALVQLLRLSERLEAADGLVAESAVYSMLQSGPEFAAWLASRPSPARRPGSGAPVMVSRTGGVLEITLNRPEVRNAYNTAMRDALSEALELAIADPGITGISIDAAGPSFCSGGDLEEFGTLPDPATAHAVRTTRSVAHLMARCRDRLTARLHGACVGAGIELAAFARNVVARNDTSIKLPEVAMGLIPGAGGTVSLPARIGRHRTAYLALSGRTIGASTALEWGLVDVLA